MLELFLLLLQEVSSEIYQKHLQAQHSELHNQVIDVFQEHYDEKDEGTVFGVFEGREVYFFGFIHFDINEFFTGVDEFEDLGVLGKLEFIIHGRV